jgi:PIN domain nuclease of toxin-antitoxin system
VQGKRILLNKYLRTLDIFDLFENEFSLQIKYVTKEHLRTLAKLETIEGHSDPSDRLIIAQALTEHIPLISSDTKFPQYRKFGLDFISNR